MVRRAFQNGLKVAVATQSLTEDAERQAQKQASDANEAAKQSCLYTLI